MTHSRRTLLSATTGTLAVLVAFTAPLANLNQTAAGLDAGPAARTWILSSMSIGLGAFLLTAGRVADDFGRRRTFVAGALLLAVGSLVAALTPDVEVFVAARVVQGTGGAAVIAAGLGMLAVAFVDPAERARATGLWGASVGAGIALGPVLSTWLGRWGSWRDVYVVLALAGVVLAATATGCPESRSPHRARLDVPGVVALAGGISALLAGLTEGRGGWDRPLTIGLLAVAVLLLAAFVVVERRSDHAMIDLGLLRRPAFAAATVAALATGAGIIALLSYVSGFAGLALGLPPTTTAWLMLAWSGPSIVTAVAARRLPQRWTGRARMGLALAVIGASQLMLWGVGTGSGAGRFVPGLLVAGVASGVLNASLGRESVASVPAGQAGLGSGANNTARYLGSALGVTVVSVVAVPSGPLTNAALVAGWNRAALVTAAVSLVGALVVLLVGKRPAPATVEVRPPTSPKWTSQTRSDRLILLVRVRSSLGT
ncbi:MAG: MFS transporter [Nocardioides sp.]